jgi:hypothetical protein
MFGGGPSSMNQAKRTAHRSITAVGCSTGSRLRNRRVGQIDYRPGGSGLQVQPANHYLTQKLYMLTDLSESTWP